MSIPTQHAMSADQLEHFGAEIEALRARTVADLGEQDARYIRKILKSVRYTEFGGRGLFMVGAFLPQPWLIAAWIVGVLLLTFSKIVDNMELGHNVMHGQFDWMGDPQFNGKTFEWDIVGTSDAWRRSHNFRHHTYTNIHGLDDDVAGFGLLRVFPEQKWSPGRVPQLIYTVVFVLMFQWGVAIQDLRIGRWIKGKMTGQELMNLMRPVLRKTRNQLIKDYLVFPLLAGPGFWIAFTGNLAANGIRNVWTFAVIFCGHLTSDVETYPRDIIKTETRAQWYVRQVRGSSNLAGGAFLNLMTGNLSHQIEHHLFPELPANRYVDMAPQVREICARYGVFYNTGSMAKQFAQVLWRIARHSFPSTPEKLEESELPQAAR
jgi:fatty acid desaturase